MEKQFTLSSLGKEEGDLMVAKLKDFFDENSIDLVVTPTITKEGTIGAKAEIFKKLELVPKDNGGEGEKTA